MTVVERLCVGGSCDGERVSVGEGAREYLCVRSRGVTFFARKDGFDAEDPRIVYRLTTAPTGEKVFLAPGAEFDAERFDVEAWVHRFFDADHLLDLHHVGPWVWRGRPDPGHPDIDPRLRDSWLYVTITPDAKWHGRYPAGVDMLDTRQFDTDAFVVEEFRRELEYRRLPICFVDGCDEKARGGEVDGLWRPRKHRDDRWEPLGPVRACPVHWHDLLKLPWIPTWGGGAPGDGIPEWLLPHLRQPPPSAFDQVFETFVTDREYALRLRFQHSLTGVRITPEQYWGKAG